MIRRPPRSTRTYTLFPYTTLVRSLGTVADVASLRGLNRAFVAQGLKVMAQRRNIGMTALIEAARLQRAPVCSDLGFALGRSEEHTSELQSLMRISYAVFCLKKKKNTNTHDPLIQDINSPQPHGTATL